MGFLQGIFEWLPVSSEGQLVIVLSKFLSLDPEAATSLALFSHIGTALVVVIYFRKEFFIMFSSMYIYIRSIVTKGQNILPDYYEQGLLLTKLIFIVTLFTLPTALISLLVFEELVTNLNQFIGISIANTVTILIGLLLIVTGFILRLRTTLAQAIISDESIHFENLPFLQSIALGLIQGLAALPGISRSGSTITYLLIGTKLDQNEALRGSFLVAVPVSIGAGFLQVLRGKIILTPLGIMSESGNALLMNYSGALIMILSSFLFGFLTLKLFLDLSKKISFDKFMIGFGIIAIAAVLIGYLL